MKKYTKEVLLMIGCCIIFLIIPNCKKEVKPNILLITIDTLRMDRLGCYGYPLDTSPFIDQLAREGLVFKHVVTPLPFTAPSHASIFTSLHPLTHQLLRNASPLDPRFDTMVEILKENGYYTIGAVAVKSMSTKYNFSQGFDSFSDQWDPDIKDWQGEFKDFNGDFQRVAKSVNKSVKEQIEDYLAKHKKHKNKPLFLWVHYYDPHIPYIDREDIALNVKRKQWIQYDKEVRYTDNYINRLYRFLEEKGLTEKLVTCITADHGEQLGEHGFGAQHVDFYSETTLVPLIFHGFKIPKNKIVEELVTTMDIGVTLLELANLNFKTPTEGISLLKSNGRPAVIPPRDQLIIGHLLYIRSLQIISFPYSFILNFDSFYKSWYFSGEIVVPEKKFKRIPDKWLEARYFEKQDSYELRVTFPHAYTYGKGLTFAALRFDIEKNHGVYVGGRLNLGKWPNPFYIDEQTKTATAFFPTAGIDILTAYTGFKKGAKVANLRYAFLPVKEFSTYTRSMKEIESKRIFDELKTLRKFNSSNELYNLDPDIKMKKNLLKRKKPKKQPKKAAVEGRIKIYKFLAYYLGKMKKILGKRVSEKEFSEKEKEMLESLGYL